MLTYWYMYLVPFFSILFPWRLQSRGKHFLLGLFGFTVALFIGLRHQVVKDWFQYLKYYNFLRDLKINLYDALFTQLEPGYSFINWVCIQFNLGIYGVNLICSTIFVYGLIFFCKNQPYPWISLAIAMPFIGCVFAMGATRQATALGIIYIAIVYLMRGSNIKYFVFICLATAFHKSAIFMLPLGIFGVGNIKFIYQFMFLVALFAAIWFFYYQYMDYITYYIGTAGGKQLTDIDRASHIAYGGGMYAYGGRVRVWMNVVPVLLYLFLSKNKALFKEQGGNFWKNLSLAIIISIPLVEHYSSATDRLNLYFSIIQIVVWPRIIYMQRSKFNKAFVAFSIFVLYSMVLFIWLNYARHRDAYVPYQNIMLHRHCFTEAQITKNLTLKCR